MKLFLDAGFALDASQSDYRDRAWALGDTAELSVATFLDEHGIMSVGAGSVLKHMRNLHSAGALKNRIARYRAQPATGRITDPTPMHTQNMLAIV